MNLYVTALMEALRLPAIDPNSVWLEFGWATVEQTGAYYISREEAAEVAASALAAVVAFDAEVAEMEAIEDLIRRTQ